MISKLSQQNDKYIDSLDDLDEAYDLIYLRLQGLAYKFKDFVSVKKIQSIYLLYKTLKKKKRPVLMGSGKFDGMMFVGTNPSIRSELENLWKDPYGIYFKSFLDEAGINHKSIWVTNIYKHPTPNNRPLTPEEIEEGWKELFLEIEFVDPKIIIALGTQVKNQFDVKINELKTWQGRQVYGMYHPSYINRSINLRPDYINSLKYIKQKHDRRKKETF